MPSVTWACVGASLPFMPRLMAPGAQIALIGTVTAYLAFAFSFWLLTREMDQGGRRLVYLGSLVAMTVSALAIGHLTGTGIGAILLMVCASVLPWVLPAGPGRVLAVAADTGACCRYS